MNKIIETSELPEGEKIYLKKDFMGWRIVQPYKDPITGKINWFNLLFGGKRNLVTLISLLLLIGLVYMGIQEHTSNLQTIASNPCSFCTSCQMHCRDLLQGIGQTRVLNNFSLSEFNLSIG